MIWISEFIKYFFRFLATTAISRSQLQLAAGVCLLISFKITPLDVSVSQICEYTDNCFTKEEVKAWEQLILVKLNWTISILTPLHFIDSILSPLRLNHLKTKVVDILVTSTADPLISAVDNHSLAVAAVDIVMEDVEESCCIQHKTTVDMITNNTIKKKLRGIFNDFDSDYESSRGSVLSHASDFYLGEDQFFPENRNKLGPSDSRIPIFWSKQKWILNCTKNDHEEIL